MAVAGDGIIIRLVIGEKKLVIDGAETEMDTAAQIVNDRTYVPLRFVAQALGYKVNYGAAASDIQ